MMLHLEKSGPYKDSYNCAVLKALYFFVKDRSTQRARKILVPWRIKSLHDATAAFDEAFFYAYDGKLKDALRCYQKAFKKPTSSTILVEIEEFLLWILSDEPNKTQFWFCLGLINYFGKNDLVAAKKDFEEFLRKASDLEFKEQRDLAKEYVDTIASA